MLGAALMQGGFRLHHAKDDYVLVTKWLPEGVESKIPEFASHYVGVGGLVFNNT